MLETVPREGYQFEPPMRLYYLTGGISLLVDSKGLSALMCPGGPVFVFFSLLPEADVRTSLAEQAGLRVLGRTNFQHADEMNDPVLSNFYIAEENSDHECLAFSQFHKWNGIATALHHGARAVDALIANRVGAQVRLCLSLIERLATAYRTVLSSTKSKPASPGKFLLTSDKYAQYVGVGIRSLFNELYSLRDATLAAAFRLHFKRTDSFEIKKLKKLVLTADDSMSRLISTSMFLDDGDKLIERMSLYRAIAQHCIGATNPIFGDVYQLSVSNGPYGELPYLVYPLYDDLQKMKAIQEGASKGVLERPPKEEAERFLGLHQHIDALEFCYDCYVRLLQISELLSSQIDIEPRAMIITDKDILEASFTNEAGKTTRVRRDKGTGKLVEF